MIESSEYFLPHKLVRSSNLLELLLQHFGLDGLFFLHFQAGLMDVIRRIFVGDLVGD